MKPISCIAVGFWSVRSSSGWVIDLDESRYRASLGAKRITVWIETVGGTRRLITRLYWRFLDDPASVIGSERACYVHLGANRFAFRLVREVVA